ncbi:MAG: MFS transporter [Nitrospinota bacterium]|nr:MFS transporter [Nitrospinota bacterium]
MFGFDRDQQAILHFTWIAFFLTFVSWFNMAPFNTTLQTVVGLTPDQIKLLMICNVALTIPARIVIGSLVDRYGPRRVFTGLLVFAGAVSIYFSLATRFGEFLVSRLLMGCAGAGFVAGIKMIAEWFPSNRMGTAQGIYAGWGNFGAAAALFTLPPIAALFPPELGWRVATAFSGLLCLIWAGVYHHWAREVPERAKNFPVSLENTIEVTSRKDLILQILLMIPLYTAMGLLVIKLAGSPAFPAGVLMGTVLLAVIVGIFILNAIRCVKVNLPRIDNGIPEEKKYEFSQIAILSLVYALTFGSELSVVSMFPQFLESTFQLTVTTAGILGSCVAFFNLITRPSGGWLSDKLGRRRILFILVFGAVIGFGFMGTINAQWPLAGVIALAVFCSLMVQSGNGACFALVPLIRKDLTGKLAGVVGAYGNVGAVFFLTILSVFDASTFFQWIGAYAFLVLLSLLFLQSFKNLHHSYH